MTYVQFNASERKLSLNTELSEGYFDFINQGGNSVGTTGQQTAEFTATETLTITKIEVVQKEDNLAPFTVNVDVDLPFELTKSSTLNVDASFTPPTKGEYEAIMRVYNTTGSQDFKIVGKGD